MKLASGDLLSDEEKSDVAARWRRTQDPLDQNLGGWGELGALFDWLRSDDDRAAETAALWDQQASAPLAKDLGGWDALYGALQWVRKVPDALTAMRNTAAGEKFPAWIKLQVLIRNLEPAAGPGIQPTGRVSNAKTDDTSNQIAEQINSDQPSMDLQQQPSVEIQREPFPTVFDATPELETQTHAEIIRLAHELQTASPISYPNMPAPGASLSEMRKFTREAGEAAVPQRLEALRRSASIETLAKIATALAVIKVREDGASWRAIGGSLGISGQAAHQRYSPEDTAPQQLIEDLLVQMAEFTDHSDTAELPE